MQKKGISIDQSPYPGRVTITRGIVGPEARNTEETPLTGGHQRNLTPLQSSNLRGIWYGLEKKEYGDQERFAGGKNDHLEKTSERIAQQTGVSERTVRNDAKFAEALATMPPELRAGQGKNCIKTNPFS